MDQPLSTRVHTLKDGTQIQLRAAIESDAKQMLEYVDLILRDGTGVVSQPGEHPTTEEEEKEWICDFVENPNQILLLAIHQDTIIGNLDFQIGKKKRFSHVGLLGMAVSPGWRSKGVGSALMATFLEWVKSRSEVEKVTLCVLANNTPAINLYRQYGFVEEGRRPRAVKIAEGIYVDDLLMYKFLR